MSIVARILIGLLGLALVSYAVMTWRSKRMPFMVGEDDAKYWGRRMRSTRVWDTVGIGVMGMLIVGTAIFR
jgi:hypothetical protein